MGHHVKCLQLKISSEDEAKASPESDFPPLRSRVAAADMDTFDFLVNLQVFSRRELQGESYLDRGHLLQCLEIGKQMRAEKKETMVDFQEFLAPFLADLRPDGEPSQREKLHEDHEAQPKKTSQDAWTMAPWANWLELNIGCNGIEPKFRHLSVAIIDYQSVFIICYNSILGVL